MDREHAPSVNVRFFVTFRKNNTRTHVSKLFLFFIVSVLGVGNRVSVTVTRHVSKVFGPQDDIRIGRINIV